MVFAIILIFSCTQENGLITPIMTNNNSMSNPQSLENPDDIESINYNPCESSKFKDLANQIFLKDFVEGYNEMKEFLNENDSSLISSLTSSELVKLMYQKKYNSSINIDLSDLDTIYELSTDTNYKNYFKIIAEVNDLIEKSDSFAQFLILFNQYTDQIDLNLINENEKVLISTFIFSLEMVLFENICIPSSDLILRWGYGHGYANMGSYQHIKKEDVQCLVSIIGGGLLGYLSGGLGVGLISATVGWGSGC